MSRTLRVRLGLVAFALLLAASIWASALLQSGLSDRRANDVGVMNNLIAGVAQADAAMLSQTAVGNGDSIDVVLETRDAAQDAFSVARASGDTPEARESLRRLERLYAMWQSSARALVLTPPDDRSISELVSHADSANALADVARELRGDLDEDGAEDQRNMTLAMIAVALLVVLGLGGAFATVYGRRERERLRFDRRLERVRHGQEEFAEAMQLVADEEEAHLLLKRHVEREIPGADATILNRNNSDNRLDATTPPPVDLESALTKGAEPRSCLAVRSGRRHERAAGDVSLVACELCGKRGRDTTCQPLLVSGEVIGAVHVGHQDGLDDLEQRGIADAVAQAAPVLGNLRTLAIAETRAATDALTGLPNRRSLQDTLKRMVAQSQRSGAALAALAVDLDHFKQVNDVFGHEKGDEVLAAVGQVLSEGMREADFAARAGGEEFVVLLPDTDAEGATVLAEKLRTSISRIEVPGVTRLITASFGVAAHPSHAFDAATLLRKADRALYLAKERGRDRVEVAPLPVADEAAHA